MINELFFKELVKRGHSREDGKRTWDVSNQSLLFSTPELAKSFLYLKHFPVYRKSVLDREISLIKDSSGMLRSAVGNKPFNLIDMRCAGGERASAFIKSIGPQVNIRYCPMSRSSHILNECVSRVKSNKFKNVKFYKPQTGDFDNLGEVAGLLRNSQFQRNVILLLGSSLATVDINDFLFNLSKEMFRGDYLIIGNGIRTGRRLVHLDVYKDKAFHGWFVHLMYGLGFKDGEVEYDARFGNSRVECFYNVLVDKEISHKGKKIQFKKGDAILVATIYKYYSKELENFCRMYFPEGEFVKDEDNEYALVVCKK